MTVLGIDVSKGQWIALALKNGKVDDVRSGPSVEALIRVWGDLEAIAIDTPIGLPDKPGRKADDAARAFVGSRRASIFITYPRNVLQAPTYEEAVAIAERRGWKKPTRQSYSMRDRIFEVEPLAADDERIVEVHPEVSFRQLAAMELERKSQDAGLEQRRAALASAGIELPKLPYPLADVLDVAVCAWSAQRYARGEARQLPLSHRERIGAIWR